MRQSRKLFLKDRASDEAQQIRVNSKRIAVSTSEDDTPGRADEALTASTSSKPMLRFSLEIMMAMLLMAASYLVHWVAQLIVTEYGLLGGVITCGALYATGLIMDRYNL
jgi:hypothetical protein